MPQTRTPTGPLPGPHQTRCHQLIALLDSAERIMNIAHRRGAPALGPDGRKIIDQWFAEKRKYENCEHPCEFCPLRPRHPKKSGK